LETQQNLDKTTLTKKSYTLLYQKNETNVQTFYEHSLILQKFLGSGEKILYKRTSGRKILDSL